MVGRLLGANERLMRWAHGPDGVHIVGRATLGGALEVDRLRRAFADLRVRYAALRYTLAGPEAAPRFEPLPLGAPLPFEAIERTASGLSRVEAMLVDPQMTQLWRAIVLFSPGGDEHELIIVLHHAIADGHALFMLLRALLERYEAPDGAIAEMPLHAATEVHLRRVVPSAWARWLLAIAALAQEVKKLVRPARTSVGAEPSGARRPFVREMSMPRAEIDRLRARCREERTTMQGLYSAAMLTAWSELRGSGRLSCAASVNLRPFCGPSLGPDAFGCFAANVETRHLVPAPLWSLARQCREGLAELLRRSVPLGWIFLVEALIRDGAKLRGGLARGHGRQQTVFVTNLGALPETKRAALQLQSAAAYVAQHQSGVSVWLGTGTFEACATFGFVFTAPLFDEPGADRFVARFAALLAAARAP
jgi:hypothetical protein